MNYKSVHDIRIFLLKLSLIGLLAVCLWGCENILSDEFKEKDFTITAIDKLAGDWLVKDTLNDAQGVTVGYRSGRGDSIKARTLQSLIDTTTYGNYSRGSLTENQVYSQLFNQMADSLQSLALLRDTLMIINPSGQKVTYARLNVTGGNGKNIYLYTSLRFTATNTNEYFSVDLIRSDTASVSYSTEMPAEAVSGCTQIISVSQSNKIIPVIRARYELHLDDGVYLVRLTASDPTVGIYKITILSF